MSARVAVLVSGGGTNLQALIDAERCGEMPNASIRLVVSNVPNAYALERAKNAGIPAMVCVKKGRTQRAFEEELCVILEQYQIELIVLAGFLAILSKDFTDRYPNRILNIHPSLIPSFCGEGFYGLRVHEAALKCGVKVTGATVHYVNEIPDGGKILLQKAVEVREGDTPETLQRRVMEEAEWKLLPQATELAARAIEEEKPMQSLFECVGATTYPGRGIVAGRTKDGKKQFFAYFIMGRSENSRNRVFLPTEDGIRTEAHDPDKMVDPSLIIYAPVRRVGDRTIVTNGDQTDTIRDFLNEGGTFADALRTRAFEPDRPNFTPRISMLAEADGRIQMAILKSGDPDGKTCTRNFFEYESIPAGEARFLHTYRADGNPIPSFEGEPERALLDGDLDELTNGIWNALNADNRVSLWTEMLDLQTGERSERIINRNREKEN
ncbi:MAG: phosphoribosylglycinamide formyltransferase [Candidatus Faecivicinus sp.]|nr:phosphoribosylglycinamide formyltransferase [Candidatus Faecivicinus sp.]